MEVWGPAKRGEIAERELDSSSSAGHSLEGHLSVFWPFVGREISHCHGLARPQPNIGSFGISDQFDMHSRVWGKSLPSTLVGRERESEEARGTRFV